MSSSETKAAWDSAEYNARRAEKAEARVAELKYALENLFALINGECPSLLEDNHHYDMVRAALKEQSDE